MPKLIPDNFDDITNNTELYFAELLRDTLPDDVILFHGRHLLMESKSMGLMPAEIDFIIVDPRKGILIIEVKGGEVRYDSELKKWMHVDSNGTKSILRSRDPYDQANSNMHNIKNLLNSKIPDFKRKYRCGYAVALPFSQFEGPLPLNMNAATLIDARNCDRDNIITALQTAMNAWKSDVTVLTEEEINTIVETLAPVYTVKIDRYAKFKSYNKTLLILTEEQSMLYLDILDMQTKVAIAGVAGSGKTVLATAKAQSEAKKGKRVLFLCYNKALAEWLNSSVEPGTIDTGYLHIDNYHHYVAHLCEEFKLDWPTNHTDLWNEYAPNQLYQIAFKKMTGSDKYDTIIIDEGQDFNPKWWDSITPLFRGSVEEQSYYVFYDPDQNIYQGSINLPPSLQQTVPIRVNCRNTKRITQYCIQLIPNGMRVKEKAPEGNEPKIHLVPNFQTALSKAEDLAATIIAEEKRLRKHQVAILCIGVPATQINAIGQRLGFTTDHKKWRKNEGVLVSDAGAFKGLESDLVIVVDNDSHDTPEAISKRYVAFSRAKLELHIIKIG
jgi:hypothetical protein